MQQEKSKIDRDIQEMVAVMRRFRRIHVEKLVDGISKGEIDLLYVIGGCEDAAEQYVRVSEIVKQAPVPASAVSRGLNRLEERGWIRRSVDRQDRRNVLVQLTKEGRSARDRSDAAIRSFFSSVCRKMGEEELHRMCQSLNKLADICRDEMTCREEGVHQ